MRFQLSTWFKILPIAVFAILLSLSIRMGDLFYDIKEDATLSLHWQKAFAEGEKRIPVPVQTTGAKTLTENELLVLQQLSLRRAELDKRQTALIQKEQELNAWQKKLTEQQNKLNDMAEKLQARAFETDSRENAELLRIYTHMKPTQAAALLNAVDHPLALYILKNIPPLQAAGILEKMAPETAARFTLEMAATPEGG